MTIAICVACGSERLLTACPDCGGGRCEACWHLPCPGCRASEESAEGRWWDGEEED